MYSSCVGLKIVFYSCWDVFWLRALPRSPGIELNISHCLLLKERMRGVRTDRRACWVLSGFVFVVCVNCSTAGSHPTSCHFSSLF